MPQGNPADVVSQDDITQPLDAGDGSVARPQGGETELDAGDLLGAWRLLGRLGQGGMGAVYLAERADGHFEQRAAIKLIRGSAGMETAAQFARERQILATLQHPHISRLLDGGATPGGQPYLVMEYVEGEPIDAWCAAHAPGLAERLRLFRDVCGAVRFAHQRLIVHCDLKPSNVFVRADGTPVLLDFGIARALDRPGPQDVGTSYLTPGYASPEQLRGEALTTASDVYALGLILFELVSGRRARLDSADRTVTLLGTALKRPSELAAAVPWRGRIAGDLDAIVLRATAFDPGKRYASAEELASDVQRFVEHHPVSAREPTAAYRLSRLLRRRWPAFASAAVVAALVAAFTWQLATERDRARAAEHEARVQATAAERVSGFLVSVFNVSNPKVASRRDVTAREVLDEGATRIGSELDGQPAIKARLLDTLGTAYRHIGEPTRAAELLRSAVALYEDPRVDRPLAAAATASQLAVVYANNLPGEDAVGEARRALALRERYAPDDAAALGDSWNTLGIALEAADQLEEAEAALRKGLALRRAAHVGKDTLASSLHNLGLVAGTRGNRQAALEFLSEALALRREVNGAASPSYQVTQRLYAVELVRDGQLDKGIALLQENLRLCLELYGPQSSHTADAHNELGSALHDQGRFRDAATHYREAMGIVASEGGTGSGNSNYLYPLNNLASAYEDMGDTRQAVPLFEKSLALRRAGMEDTAAPVLRAQQNLARVLVADGQLARAKPLLDHAIDGFRARFGEDDSTSLKARLVLGSWLAARNDIEGLQALLKQLHGSSATFTPLMTSREALLDATVARSRGNAARALDRQRTAWTALRDGLGAEHPFTAAAALAYALALSDSGDAAAAAPLATAALPVVDAAFVAGSAPARDAARWRAESNATLAEAGAAGERRTAPVSGGDDTGSSPPSP